MAILISLSQTSFGITAKEAKVKENKSCKQIHDKFYRNFVDNLIPEAASEGNDGLEVVYFGNKCHYLDSKDANKLKKLGYTVQMSEDGYITYVIW